MSGEKTETFKDVLVKALKENASLKEALAELIPIASKARGIEFPGEEFQKAVKAIDSAKKLLNKQPQSESDGDKNL